MPAKFEWKKRTQYSLSAQNDQYRVSLARTPKGLIYTAWLRDGQTFIPLKYFYNEDKKKARLEAMRFCSSMG